MLRIDVSGLNKLRNCKVFKCSNC